MWLNFILILLFILLIVVSTTLWVGHLSKLIHQDDLFGLFQPIGDIVSLNLISPRGCAFLCMNRRQDAARIMSKFQGERLQGKPMTVNICYKKCHFSSNVVIILLIIEIF